MDYDTVRFMCQLLGEELNWERPTLRDQFAMAALTGIMHRPSNNEPCGNDLLAKSCYSMADAMLKARRQNDE